MKSGLIMDAGSPHVPRAILQELVQKLRLWGARERSLAGNLDLEELLRLSHSGRGLLVEWLVAEEGTGAMSLLAAGMDRVTSGGRGWVVVDPGGEFHAAGVVKSAADLERLVLVRPRSAVEAAWVVEQSLRCRGVGVTWACVDRVSEKTVRRWKLAVEVGGGLGVLFRSDRVRTEASWADMRWRLTPLPMRQITVRRWRAEVLYCRGGLGGQDGDVELDVATRAVRVVSSVGNPTSLPSAAGA